MHDPFCYTFRFCCDPGYNDLRETETLKDFVRAAKVDDVSVFCNVEELNTGHMRPEEQEIYLDLIRLVCAGVEPLGCTVSVNHWHSLMHADLGKKLPPDQTFGTMTDMDGRTSDLCICPLSEEWIAYFTELYGRYAGLSPFVLWVEDDFRLHNHDPLRWGGCFCDAHMAEYSKRAGKTLTREEFVRGILHPGSPHPYRKIWLDVSRETMRSLAERIGAAVHDVNPSVRVGLMSSVPYVHAAEGRDWKGILRGFGGPNAPVSRVHLPAYQEMAPRDYLLRFNMVSMANRAFLPEDTEIYPELENYPYSLFSKSVSFTRFQLLSAMPLGLAGMTIDLFDLNGSGIVMEDGYQQMLRDVKPFLNLLNDRGIFRCRQLGVRVMTCETSAYTLHTKNGQDMEELYPQEVFFAGLLNAMGIPFRYCTDPTISGAVAAVSGQYFRNLTEEQIRQFFEYNAVILNGDALDVLKDRGLLCCAGIEDYRWMQQNGGEYTFEQVENGLVCGGIHGARASSVISGADAVNVRYEAPVEVMTGFYDSFRRRACHGHALADGRVLVYPFGHFSDPQDIPPMLLNGVRRELMQQALTAFGRMDAPVAVGAAYLQPYCTADEGHLYVYLVNGSMDCAQRIVLRFPKTAPAACRVLYSDCREEQVTCSCDGALCTLPLHLASMDALLLTFERF